MSKPGSCKNLLYAIKKLIYPLNSYANKTILPKPHTTNCDEFRQYVKELRHNNYVPQFHIQYDPNELVTEISYNYDPYGEHVYIFLK